MNGTTVTKKKVFDTFNHKKLFDKMKCIGNSNISKINNK